MDQQVEEQQLQGGEGKDPASMFVPQEVTNFTIAETQFGAQVASSTEDAVHPAADGEVDDDSDGEAAIEFEC